MTQVQYHIFSIKVTEFDQGERDPFGFDDFSEKLGDKYLPFSGTVRKPIYFLFVNYVNEFLKTKDWNARKKKEAKLRLEKLLVYSWKNNIRNSRQELRKANIIGNSKEKINPFKGNDGNWVVQTCFDIYGNSVKKVITDNKFIERYRRENQGEETVLSDFLNKEGVFDKKNEIFLEDTLQRLAKKSSLFSGNLQPTSSYKNIFRGYLRDAIKNTNKDYYNDINFFFNPKNKFIDKLYKRTIEDEKKYRFKELNNWFSAFILAVDKDINNENHKSDWQKTNSFYKQIKWDIMPVGKLSDRPISDKLTWFEKQGNKYIKIEEGKNKFNQEGWDALIRRANRENFYDFKHFALTSLLQDINKNEK